MLITSASSHFLSVHISFILFCDFQEERLINRKTETEDSLKRRLQAAREEMEYGKFLHVAMGVVLFCICS